MWGAEAQLSAVQQGAITIYTPQLSKGRASNSAGRNTNVVKVRLHIGQAGTVQLLQQDRLLHMHAMGRKQERKEKSTPVGDHNGSLWQRSDPRLAGFKVAQAL